MASGNAIRSLAPTETLPITVGGVLSEVVRHPVRRLVRLWNWKTAVVSVVVRASIFFTVNVTSSWNSAVDAVVTECMFRAWMSGTLASLSQAFRRVRPAWRASLVMLLALPALGHGIEFTVHSLRGTDRLYASVAVSILFSMFSCVFSYWLHRRSVLIVGEGARPFVSDIVELPHAVYDLLVRKPLRWYGVRSCSAGPADEES